MGKILNSFAVASLFLSLCSPTVAQTVYLSPESDTTLNPEPQPTMLEEMPESPAEPIGLIESSPELSPDIVQESHVFGELEPQIEGSLENKVCCQLDEGVNEYRWQFPEACADHLVVSKEHCMITTSKCCCALDNGPGTPGTWKSPIECQTEFCLPGEADPYRGGDPNACVVIEPRIPNATYRIVPDPSHEVRYQRLRNISPGFATTSSGLCAADRMKPGEKCRDTIQCSIDANKNMTCRACDGGDCIPWNPPSKPPVGTHTKGFPFASSCIWWPGYSQYRNLMSRYLSGENINDMQAKAFYSLNGSNTDVANKMVKLFNAMADIRKGPNSPVDNFTREMLEREVNIGTLHMGPNSAYEKCLTHKQQCGNDNFCYVGVTVGNSVQVFYVDEWKRRYAETMDSDLTIFSNGLQDIKDVNMRSHVRKFLTDSALYVGNFLIVEHWKDSRLIDVRKKELNAILNHLNNTLIPYARQNP